MNRYFHLVKELKNRLDATTVEHPLFGGSSEHYSGMRPYIILLKYIVSQASQTGHSHWPEDQRNVVPQLNRLLKTQTRSTIDYPYAAHIITPGAWPVLQYENKNIPVAPQPPYSPDLSPCDFFLFPKLKNHLKGHHFGTLENIQTAVTDHLKAIPISEFHQCYEEWKKRLQRCVASEGSYFEGDNVEL
ncbi:putative transposase [Trichonephila clavipes]|nr:putative transposase [Trichonephila clavipes]